MGPQRRMEIYVGFDSPTIIKYLEPTTGDLFKAMYADCHFDESEHPTLGRENSKLVKQNYMESNILILTRSSNSGM